MQKTLYKNSIGAAIGDGLILAFSAMLVFGSVLPFFILKMMKIFRKEDLDEKSTKTKNEKKDLKSMRRGATIVISNKKT